jgi:phage shock protein PspC (stress-responsive transcriptional regulator)
MNTVFVRENGVFGGVCGGLAKRLDVPVFILRLALVISFFCTFGITFLVYLSAVLAFPTKLTLSFGEGPKFLGVCHRLAPRLGIHETWLRFSVLIAWIATAFVPVFALYMIAFLMMAMSENTQNENPSGFRDVN